MSYCKYIIIIIYTARVHCRKTPHSQGLQHYVGKHSVCIWLYGRWRRWQPSNHTMYARCPSLGIISIIIIIIVVAVLAAPTTYNGQWPAAGDGDRLFPQVLPFGRVVYAIVRFLWMFSPPQVLLPRHPLCLTSTSFHHEQSFATPSFRSFYSLSSLFIIPFISPLFTANYTPFSLSLSLSLFSTHLYLPFHIPLLPPIYFTSLSLRDTVIVSICLYVYHVLTS